MDPRRVPCALCWLVVLPLAVGSCGEQELMVAPGGLPHDPGAWRTLEISVPGSGAGSPQRLTKSDGTPWFDVRNAAVLGDRLLVYEAGSGQAHLFGLGAHPLVGVPIAERGGGPRELRGVGWTWIGCDADGVWRLGITDPTGGRMGLLDEEDDLSFRAVRWQGTAPGPQWMFLGLGCARQAVITAREMQRPEPGLQTWLASVLVGQLDQQEILDPVEIASFPHRTMIERPSGGSVQLEVLDRPLPRFHPSHVVVAGPASARTFEVHSLSDTTTREWEVFWEPEPADSQRALPSGGMELAAAEGHEDLIPTSWPLVGDFAIGGDGTVFVRTGRRCDGCEERWAVLDPSAGWTDAFALPPGARLLAAGASGRLIRVQDTLGREELVWHRIQ